MRYSRDEPLPIETTEKVERTETGYRLSVESTRGTGTRDQDKVKVEARTQTLRQLMDEKREIEEAVRETLGDVRGFQPDEEDTDD